MLTPLDLKDKKFKKGVFGYNVEDVEVYYEELINDYENLYKENIEMKDKVETLNDAITYYKTLESGIDRTISQAQNSAEEIINNAKKEAENIVKETEIKQMSIIEQYNQDVIRKQQEIEEMRKSMQIYKVKIETLLRTQLEMLGEM